jgi:hypothetical protein
MLTHAQFDIYPPAHRHHRDPIGNHESHDNHDNHDNHDTYDGHGSGPGAAAVKVKVLVTRLGRNAPVRKAVGFLVDAIATFADLFAQTLTFGQSPMAEVDVVLLRAVHSMIIDSG